MTDSWIGGDFAGLQHMGMTLTNAVPSLEGVVKPLNSGAESLVGDSGWQGDAATSFRGKWTTDAMTAGAYSDLVGAVGKTLGSLGDSLAALNSALYNAAHTAKSKGIQLGPQGEPLCMATGDQAAENEYTQVYNTIMAHAQQARVEAAQALQGYMAEISPDASDESMLNSDKVTVGIFLRDLYASRDDRKSQLAEKAEQEVKDAEAKKAAAKTVLRQEVKDIGVRMQGVRSDLDSFKDYKAAAADLRQSETKLADALDSRNAFSKLVNFKAGDIAGLSEALSKFKYAPDFLKDIPVVDVAAALVAGGFEAKQDHDEGWSWTHAALVDGGIAVGGVVAGCAAVALLPEAVTVAGAVAVGTAAVGTALVVGVGIDKLVHEHWSEDIHDHGVVGGLAHGSWDVVKGTGKSIADDAKGLWHGVTSLF